MFDVRFVWEVLFSFNCCLFIEFVKIGFISVGGVFMGEIGVGWV